MPSTSTALRVIVASALAAALTPPQPGRHALRARPQQPGKHALRARPLAAALVETAGLVPDGARHVSEDLVKKTNAVYSFKVTDEGTDWYLDLKNGAGSCGQGESPAAVDASFKMSSANFGKMFAGKLKPTAAFMTGRLKIEGNMGKAMKLEKLMGQMQKRGYHTVGNSKL